MSITKQFNDFSESQIRLAGKRSTLAISFGLAAACYLIDPSLAVGPAVAPTLLYGSGLVIKGATKAIDLVAPD